MPASYPRPVLFRGNGTNVVFDFGIEVGGIASLTYTRPMVLALSAWRSQKHQPG